MSTSVVMNERGSAGIKAVIAFIILGAIIYVGLQLVPVLWDHWNLEDDIMTKMKFAFINYRGDVKKQLTNDIYGLLDDIGAQYKKENVRITVDEQNKKILVKVWYSREHKVPYYPPNPWQFYLELKS